MKNILFLIVFCININVSCKTPPKTKDIKISDFVGKWYYSANDETLTLNLESTKNNGIIGKKYSRCFKKRYSLFKIYRVL